MKVKERLRDHRTKALGGHGRRRPWSWLGSLPSRTSLGRLVRLEWSLCVTGVISATSLKLSQNKKEKGKRKIKEIAFIILHSDERACVCSGLRREGRSLHTAFSSPPLGSSGSKAPLRHLDPKKKKKKATGPPGS